MPRAAGEREEKVLKHKGKLLKYTTPGMVWPHIQRAGVLLKTRRVRMFARFPDRTERFKAKKLTLISSDE